MNSIEDEKIALDHTYELALLIFKNFVSKDKLEQCLHELNNLIHADNKNEKIYLKNKYEEIFTKLVKIIVEQSKKESLSRTKIPLC